MFFASFRVGVSQYVPVRISSQKGFSLVEAMVVLGIVAITLLFAVPEMRSWRANATLKTAARELYSNLQRIRLRAVKENKDMAIVFDPVNQGYFLCAQKGSSWANCTDIIKTVSLADYASGVQYGHGDIDEGNSASSDNPAFPDDDISYGFNLVSFNSQGTGSSGYVYLQRMALSHEGENVTNYAVGTASSGIIMLKKWNGTEWQ